MTSQLSERNIVVIVFLGILTISASYFYYRRYLQFRNTPVEVVASPHLEITTENSVDRMMMSAEAISFKSNDGWDLDDDDIPKPTEAFQSTCIIAENIKAYE